MSVPRPFSSGGALVAQPPPYRGAHVKRSLPIAAVDVAGDCRVMAYGLRYGPAESTLSGHRNPLR
jgi:hypothetical protein